MSYIIILFISVICALIIFYFATKYRQSPGAGSLFVFGTAFTVASAANFSIYRESNFNIFFYYSLFYLASIICYTAILTYTIEFTRSGNWLKPNLFAILAIEPAIILLWLWTNATSQLATTSLNFFAPSSIYENPLFLINTIYTNSLLLLALVILSWKLSDKPLVYQRQTWFILAGVSASLIISNILIGTNYLTTMDLKLISILAFICGLVPGFLHSKIMQVVPITRASVVEHMSDGWIVLDRGNNIVDLNPRAEIIIGKTTLELAGQSAEKIFENWPNLKNSLNEARPLDVKGSVQIGDVWTYLNIYIAPLTDNTSEAYGKLIVWRDITDRRLADDSRQQARDEMFILLHSITSAAGRALNLDDFLQEIIYQIVYSSNSQSIAVYLIEVTENKKTTFTLAAQHGLPSNPEGKIFSIPQASQILDQVIEHGKLALIADIQSDERIPKNMKSFGPLSLLVLPMVMEGKVLGLISFTREGVSGYTPDEIERLAIVTDEVASFIDSNRQRQLSISLAERQRLVRDLHDSVTQQLYGLVMLAEASRAGIKAGVTDMPAKVIDNMADNARQALKEMRLFLYQMQPVDFARDGLELTLQQRLAAVEGRANINAKLVIDKKITLPVELQLALYFITEEALNNTLKHAKAKNVSVSLKKRRINYVLEITDDGQGFDPLAVKTGGIGIRSIKERVNQIGGKFKIVSAIGEGTKITVTVDDPERAKG